ncbi:MAG TPA: phosphatidylglycerol lysyltransferase domain-containing protein [bacterium]|nr:phosphatidylglycerol lysyltransferase domain-containing protein [bacterium]
MNGLNGLIFKKIVLEDKDFLNSFLKPYNFKTHEFCFTNLYIWRDFCDIEYAVYKNCLIIKKLDALNLEPHFMQPINFDISDFREIIDLLAGLTKKFEMKYIFRDAEEDFAMKLEEFFPGKFLIKLDRDNSDYIYEKQNFIDFSNKKLKPKRRQFNQFVKTYDFQFSEINRSITGDCIAFIENEINSNILGDLTRYEMNANIDLFLNFEKLDLFGVSVYANGKIAGYIVGERLNRSTGLMHIAKADKIYKGIFAFLKHKFASSMELNDAEFINDEQDLGIESLRIAKKMYCPVKLEPKYIITLK